MVDGLGGTFAGCFAEGGMAGDFPIEEEVDGAGVVFPGEKFWVVLCEVEGVTDDEGVGGFSGGKGGADAACGDGGDVEVF